LEEEREFYHACPAQNGGRSHAAVLRSTESGLKLSRVRGRAQKVSIRLEGKVPLTSSGGRDLRSPTPLRVVPNLGIQLRWISAHSAIIFKSGREKRPGYARGRSSSPTSDSRKNVGGSAARAVQAALISLWVWRQKPAGSDWDSVQCPCNALRNAHAAQWSARWNRTRRQSRRAAPGRRL
jgi:hypothetical protein